MLSKLADHVAGIILPFDPALDNRRVLEDRLLALGKSFAPPAIIALTVMVDCVCGSGKQPASGQMTGAVARNRAQRTITWMLELDKVSPLNIHH